MLGPVDLLRSDFVIRAHGSSGELTASRLARLVFSRHCWHRGVRVGSSSYRSNQEETCAEPTTGSDVTVCHASC